MDRSTDWPIRIRDIRWRLPSILVGLFVCFTSRLYAFWFNKTRIHNIQIFKELTQRRPKGKPLITVSNHYSCCDDPIVFGAMMPLATFFRPLSPAWRWSLGAREVCFSKPLHSLFFRLGQVLPIERGKGVYQPVMNEALEELNMGAWLHIFPEGKVNDQKTYLRLKWGVGRLIAESKVTPIVLPFFHLGLDDILPNKEPYTPQKGQKATILVGEPLYLDDIVKKLKDAMKTEIEMRKEITDLIQEELFKLRKKAEIQHEQNYKTSKHY